MKKQIPNLARMRAFNGDYTVFTTTTGEQGIADRQGNVIYGPTAKHQHICHSWGTIFEIMTVKPHFQLQQIDARTGQIISKCIQYPGLGTDIVYREGKLLVDILHLCEYRIELERRLCSYTDRHSPEE